MPLCVPESILLLSNVCQKCAEPLPTRGTGRCVAEQSPLERLHGSYLYDTPVGPAIKALKFDDVRAVGAVLGTMLNIEVVSRSGAELVQPVPLHDSRLRSIGFNQSASQGQLLAYHLDIYFPATVWYDLFTQCPSPNSRPPQHDSVQQLERLW